MSKISAVISAFNEEENIKRCLGSLKFADEIVVVDNESTDFLKKIIRSKLIFKKTLGLIRHQASGFLVWMPMKRSQTSLLKKLRAS
ncbi:MAG: Beta-1,4-glucosyltransferase [Candidatus Levybacteria bacterium GW2011_GWA1_39_32]|nr:MAG: Beta-1,4-glucosyltransferase [Candidatus Levybacteria bacterium GW2011_GWA1_39_32]